MGDSKRGRGGNSGTRWVDEKEMGIGGKGLKLRRYKIEERMDGEERK